MSGRKIRAEGAATTQGAGVAGSTAVLATKVSLSRDTAIPPEVPPALPSEPSAPLSLPPCPVDRPGFLSGTSSPGKYERPPCDPSTNVKYSPGTATFGSPSNKKRFISSISQAMKTPNSNSNSNHDANHEARTTITTQSPRNKTSWTDRTTPLPPSSPRQTADILSGANNLNGVNPHPPTPDKRKTPPVPGPHLPVKPAHKRAHAPIAELELVTQF